MNRYYMRRMQGFSLMELIVVVAIIGILAAIAIPNYTDYLRKTRRADGKAALQTAAQAMERHYTENGSYTGATLATFNLTTSSERYYNLTLTIPAGGATFSIDAAPTGAQTDDPCGTFSINQAGTRSVSGGSLTSAQCW